MLGARREHTNRIAATAAIATAAVAVTLMTGCGTSRASQSGTGPAVPVPRTAQAGPVAGSARQAQRLAGELLSRLTLPAGSRRVPWHPPPALRQTQIALGVTHQADVRRLWQVPMSLHGLAGYLRAHRPAGLPFQGFGQARSGGQIYSEITTFFLRPVPAGIQSAQLALEIAPAGRNLSTLRADGEVIWYPPRSAAEYLVPARFRAVTVAAGSFSRTPHTVRRTFTSPSVIARLARFFNSLPATPGGLTGCPMVTATYAVTFRFSAGARPLLTASVNGCGTVGIVVNGQTQPALADPTGLITRAVLAALAGHPGSIGPVPGHTAPVPVPSLQPVEPLQPAAGQQADADGIRAPS
jgi:hypothetical protein